MGKTNAMCIGFNLLYRVSRDGMESSEFYKRCGVENTLCVIEAQNKENKVNVLGGFTSKKWDMQHEKQEDDEAFLYLLRSSEDYPAQIFGLLPERKVVITSINRYVCFFGETGSGPLWVKEKEGEDTGIDTHVEHPFDVPKSTKYRQ